MVLPKVAMIKEEHLKTNEAKTLYASMREAQGAVPKWMMVMANDEDIVVNFFALFKVIMDDNPVNQTLKWKVAHRVSELNQCKYCIGVAASKLKGLGISESDLKALNETATKEEKVALEFAEQVVNNAYAVPDITMDNLKNTFSDEQVVEITSAIGLFNFINSFNDALSVLPDTQ